MSKTETERLPSQIQRMALRAEALSVARPTVTAALRSEITVPKIARSDIKGTQPANNGTGRRGRPKSALTKAERQRLYREKKVGML